MAQEALSYCFALNCHSSPCNISFGLVGSNTKAISFTNMSIVPAARCRKLVVCFVAAPLSEMVSSGQCVFEDTQLAGLSVCVQVAHIGLALLN